MKHHYLKNVSTLTLNEEKCTGCGVCKTVCPHGIFEIRSGKAVILDKDACIECGACAKNCAFSALQVESGVGCAFAILNGMFRGTAPTCDSNDSGDKKQKNGCC